MKKRLPFLLICILCLGIISLLDRQQAVQASSADNYRLNTEPLKIDPAVEAFLEGSQPGDMLTVIVTLRQQANLSQLPEADRAMRQRGVIRALQATANATQGPIINLLTTRSNQGLVSSFDPFWVFNGLSVTATVEVIDELAQHPDVRSISPDNIPVVAAGSVSPEQNISVINAPSLWDAGLYGQGIVVASMDSGVDASHPELAARWRGGNNSWFDPYGQHTTPFDMSGHGTQTTGLIVGGEAGGTAIGVAPQAQWIAVKIFNDAGSSTASAIHLGFQWLLDPDGNPDTADAPWVVNNSWSYGYPGCNLEFQLDLQALLAAGITPVFAAGNFGPSSATSVSPANYPEAFAVGATNNNDQIYAYSSRGPSSCGESQTIYPELVAPGVNVKTTDLYSLYTQATGTSLSAPEVSGALALLLSAYPDLTVAQQESALKNSAVDLGAVGPDNDFGYGRLDLLASYDWLLAGGANNPTPTAQPPTPTPTAQPPTPTPTALPPTPDPTVNLALNQPVTVSSFQDVSHSGNMAVDGNLATYWQSSKASGKSKLSEEWIIVDLGGSTSIGQIVLEWADNYATQYSIQVSNDSSAWTTVYNTSNGDGGNDTLTFGSTSARFIQLKSSAWNNGSLRNWLKEFEIYASSGGPLPTYTPTPLPTSTPLPTATATPPPATTATPNSGSTMHVGDLDNVSTLSGRKNWNGSVAILVHGADHSPVSGATVYGTWSDGVSGDASCLTDASGLCTLTTSKIALTTTSVTFTVDTVSGGNLTYLVTANHDPDGDSDGTAILLSMP